MITESKHQEGNNANTVLAAVLSVHETIDQFYPTINHQELGELYCRDKVVLIMRQYAEQFKANYYSEDAINRIKADYFQKGLNAGGSPI